MNVLYLMFNISEWSQALRTIYLQNDGTHQKSVKSRKRILIQNSNFPQLGLNEIYVWFLLPTYPNFLTLPLTLKWSFEKNT